MTDRRLRVGVIFGGRSGEHDVSLQSAASILAAIDPQRYEVVPIAITREGRWLLADDALVALTEGVDDDTGQPVAVLGDPSARGLVALDAEGGLSGLSPRHVDVIFPILHGTCGEDGTIQGLLELANLPYVGAGVMASAVGLDKGIMKDLFVRHGLPTARYRVYRVSRWRRDAEAVIDEIEETLGYPCFVKPVNLGSSVGIHKAADRAGLRTAIDDAARYDRKVIVEEAVPGAREIEVSVLGNDEPITSVPGEIVPSREFYDYRAKYLDDDSELIVPAPLEPEQAEQVRRLALAAYRAVDCEGMARVDFLVNRSTGEIYLNELNTIPGFTRISMYPKLWEASGIPYPELIDRLIELAVERWQAKQSLETTYTPDSET